MSTDQVDQTNPYESPQRDQSFAGLDGGEQGVTPRVLEYMAGTKPWVQLFSVMLLIGSALMILGGVGMMMAGGGMPETVVSGVGYLLGGILYLMPALFLWRYASAIGELLFTRSGFALEEFLRHQKSFWKFVGIMTVVLLCIYGAVLVLVVLALRR